jgi:hypothetical protein
MCRKYNEKHGLIGKKNSNGKSMERTDNAFTMALRRMNIDKNKRLELKNENGKAQDTKDIEEYSQVKTYLLNCDVQNITNNERIKTLTDLRRLWEWKERTNPTTWTYEQLIDCVKEHLGKDDKGKWKKPHATLKVLGAFNRCFQGVLPKGWSMPFTKGQAGKMKDFWEYEELNDFLSKVELTKKMSKLGWLCIYTQHVNRGCREGIDCQTGILSARWEQINYATRRTEQIDKGEKGNSQRLWKEVPCDMFSFLNAWKILLEYHREVFGYYPTNSKHGNGRMFLIAYWDYKAHFHETRKKCNGRLSDNNEKRRLHVFRMIHGQYAKRLGVTLENLCGDTDETPCIGRYGVGWSDPKIPLRFYLTKEPYEYAEQDEMITRRLFEMEHGLKEISNAPLFAWRENMSLESTRFQTPYIERSNTTLCH